MIVHFRFLRVPLLFGVLILLGPGIWPSVTPAQDEATSVVRRYGQYEVSTGYYEDYEVLPRHQRPPIPAPDIRQGLISFSPGAAAVRNRSHLADSHMGIPFYWGRRCEDCHIEQARSLHTVRANLTCRQCHGGEPIASIHHYYSPMNPIRRHAYICAKCHEGASASYASYIIHEPPAGSVAARKSFPILFYAYWFMLILLVGTLAFFIPHSFLTGMRELLERRRKE